MSALSIQVPFPVFQDRDGQPLDNGYVWIGVTNLNPQTNPVVAYYDAALTIVAAQPLRTINGYISRAGTPAQVYVDGANFSILVQDSKGSMVYNFPDGSGISSNASGVVYDPAGTGAVATTVQTKLRESVSVLDFGCVENETDSTTKYQNAINYAIANGLSLDISGNYNVTSISLNGASGLRLTGRGSVVGIATISTDSIVTMKNVVNIAIDGAWFVNGNYNTNYINGVWIYTDAVGQQASYLDFTNLSVVSCARAWKFGNELRVDDLVSEINIRGGMTYGCPSVIYAVGAQTVVNFTGCTLASLTGSGNAGWQALPQKTVVALGATINIVGGELLHVLVSTGGSSTTFNTLCEVQAIASIVSGNIYGNITVTGAVVECAVRLASSANISALVSPTAGLISFTGCQGVSTQDTSAFVETDASFLGRLQFTGNRFFATSARTNSNITCGGLCDVYCDSSSFGSGFKSYLEGITGGGGIAHFPLSMVLNVNNLNAESLVNATPTTLIFTNQSVSNDLVRFSGNYSTTTGIFTVPSGGLKNIQVTTQLLKTGLLGEWYVQINGVSLGVRTLGNYNFNSYSIDSLNAGDTIKVVTLLTSATTPASSTVTDWFQIFASNP